MPARLASLHSVRADYVYQVLWLLARVVNNLPVSDIFRLHSKASALHARYMSRVLQGVLTEVALLFTLTTRCLFPLN